MRIFSIILFFSVPWLVANAQKIVRLYYDREGFETDSASSYYNDMLIFEGDNDPRVMSYYSKSGKMRMSETVPDSQGEKLKLFYYENGELKSEGHFFRSEPRGLFQSYYPNGRHQSELVYEQSDEEFGVATLVGIINYWDSLGNQLVENGDGKCVCNLMPFSDQVVLESGRVEKGMKMGEWKGMLIEGGEPYTFKEEFDKGHLVQGTQQFKGVSYDYDRIYKRSGDGGSNALARHMKKNIHYPQNARRRNVEGKVFVQFIIDEQGHSDKVKIVRGIDPECDAEARKIVESMPLSTPAELRGRPVKQKIFFPVIFQLKR